MSPLYPNRQRDAHYARTLQAASRTDVPSNIVVRVVRVQGYIGIRVCGASSLLNVDVHDGWDVFRKIIEMHPLYGVSDGVQTCSYALEIVSDVRAAFRFLQRGFVVLVSTTTTVKSTWWAVIVERC